MVESPSTSPAPTPSLLGSLSRAAYKKARSIVRSFHLAQIHPHWQARAELCARCPIAVTDDRTLYCGKPFLSDIVRRPEQGCGCPIIDKAQDPDEHCPVTPQLTPRDEAASPPSSPCNCKWCQSATTAAITPSARP